MRSAGILMDSRMSPGNRTTQHALLGREENVFLAPNVAEERVLVTGSSGSIGSLVCDMLRKLGAPVQEFDIIEGLDVTNLEMCMSTIQEFAPTSIIHLAAHKYATSAEVQPYDVADLNIHATHYLCATARKFEVRNVIVASTCKAVQPETVYGASKLIAERIALNFGYTVARFFNVVESAGNVFEIWREQVATGRPMQVTPCRRYFISADEAVSFVTHLLAKEPGRYAPFPGDPTMIVDMARRFNPDYPVEHVAPRRGDRIQEPLVGDHETYHMIDNKLMVIRNSHDLDEREASELPPQGMAYP